MQEEGAELLEGVAGAGEGGVEVGEIAESPALPRQQSRAPVAAHVPQATLHEPLSVVTSCQGQLSSVCVQL